MSYYLNTDFLFAYLLPFPGYLEKWEKRKKEMMKKEKREMRMKKKKSATIRQRERRDRDSGHSSNVSTVVRRSARLASAARPGPAGQRSLRPTTSRGRGSPASPTNPGSAKERPRNRKRNQTRMACEQGGYQNEEEDLPRPVKKRRR
ncbi:hypothetical protein ElyMa_002329700 [Elysia marginata]|uniref:Uncharacterized protein n=1 Tax=Elysia marginata TaxID=1093978 RepID=A0AAV4G6C1_9GAST|nr:hypothetical protein ElyMa_002329700 [Elysia marginata]